jgi:hypothetical protein
LIRYLWVVAARSRAPLLPLAVTLFMLIGVFADPRQSMGQVWGLSAVVCCALAALLVGGVLSGEPAPQADMATVAVGGRARRNRLDLTLVAVTSLGLTVAWLAYPLVLTRFRAHLFTRPVQLGDVVGAGLALTACTVLGGTLGVLFAPPRVSRRATAVAATLAALIVLVALSSALGWASGPVGVAVALGDAAAGTVSIGEVDACLACLVLAGACVIAARAWTRRVA